MNHSFLTLLNEIKMTLQVKKLNMTIKYSKQNLQFLQYLRKQGFLSSVIKKKRTLLIILKYELSLIPALSSVSISSKISRQRPKKLVNNKMSNLTINLTENDDKYTRLLARFR